MSTGHVSVFCQNLGITFAYYFNFKKEFLFNNARILEINDCYNRSRGNVSFTEISEIIIYQIKNLLGWINIDWGQVWERLRKCVAKWIKQKKVREMKVAWVTFLVHLFHQYWQTWLLAQVLGKVHHWRCTKDMLWKVSFLEHCLNKFVVCRRPNFYWTSA